MALATHLSLVTLFLVLPFTLRFAQSGHINETTLRFYIIVDNNTVVNVAGVQGQYWSPTTFGTIGVSDYRVVDEPSVEAPEVARIEGLGVAASRDGSYNFQTSTTRFTRNEYNGSTLETQGLVRIALRRPTEFAVVGGTGQFKGARGIGILEIIDQTYDYSISQVIYRFLLPA